MIDRGSNDDNAAYDDNESLPNENRSSAPMPSTTIGDRYRRDHLFRRGGGAEVVPFLPGVADAASSVISLIGEADAVLDGLIRWRESLPEIRLLATGERKETAGDGGEGLGRVGSRSRPRPYPNMDFEEEKRGEGKDPRESDLRRIDGRPYPNVAHEEEREGEGKDPRESDQHRIDSPANGGNSVESVYRWTSPSLVGDGRRISGSRNDASRAGCYPSSGGEEDEAELRLDLRCAELMRGCLSRSPKGVSNRAQGRGAGGYGALLAELEAEWVDLSTWDVAECGQDAGHGMGVERGDDDDELGRILREYEAAV